MSAKLQLIVAMDKNRCMGKDNALPWHFPEDLKRFKRLTLNHSIIMGRKTHESIGRPLPKRRNIVITRNNDALFEGCEVANSFEEAVVMARKTDEEPFVVGGESVFKAALPIATRIYLTQVTTIVNAGDTFMPPFGDGWTVVSRVDYSSMVFSVLDRVEI